MASSNKKSYSDRVRWALSVASVGLAIFAAILTAHADPTDRSGVRQTKDASDTHMSIRSTSRAIEVQGGSALTRGDCDGNDTVDLLDHTIFTDCLLGPGGGLSLGCECVDVDGDSNVTLFDYWLFQRDFLPPGSAVVPQVQGLGQVAAESSIALANLLTGTVAFAHSETVSTGSVISQDPPAGTSVATGTAVNLVVSLGSALVVVPDVVGLDQLAAEDAIPAASLTIGLVTTAFSDTVPAGLVIFQDPPAGAAVLPATAVDLVVSLGVLMATVPDVVGLTEASATTEIESVNLMVGAVTEAFSDAISFGNVVDQTPVAGSTVPEGTLVNIVTSLGPALRVTLTSPMRSMLTSSTAIDVAGTVSDLSATVDVNGIPAIVSAGDPPTFLATAVPIVEGNNILSATAREGIRLSSAEVSVTRDTAPPTAVIESPSPGQVVCTTMVTIVGQVNDIVLGNVGAEDCGVVVSGPGGLRVAEIMNGTFLVRNFLLAPGPNTITALPTDTAGNVGSPATVDVTRQILAGQQLRVLSGNDQVGVVGQMLPASLVVQALDASGAPLAGRTLTFGVVRNNGTLGTTGESTASLNVMTDTVGEATVNWTLGERVGAGNNRVMVSAVGFVAPVQFCATGTVGTCALLIANAGDKQVGEVGELLPRPIQVLALDAMGNACAGVSVTFTVDSGGGMIDGADSSVVVTSSDGFAAANLTVGPLPGTTNNIVSAAFVGLLEAPASFVASAVEAGPEDGTTFSGVVLDTENRPIPAATVSIKDTIPPVTTTTDAAGLFNLVDVPVGSHHLVADGATSTRPGPWPRLAFQVEIISGIDNRLGSPVYIPQLDGAGFQVVGGAADVDLQLAGVSGFSLKVFANSVTFPNGATSGSMGVTQVSNDQVPMPPTGGAAPPWVMTVQPAGVRFDPPAQVTAPNSEGASPGTIVDMVSFDHDLNDFVGIGTGTVQADGATIVSDPGFGIVKSGWWLFRLPPPPPLCACSCNDDDPCTKDLCSGQPSCVCTHEPITPTADFDCCDGQPYNPMIQGCCESFRGGVRSLVYEKSRSCCIHVDGIPSAIAKHPMTDDTSDGKLNCPNPVATKNSSQQNPGPGGTWRFEYDGCSGPNGILGVCSASTIDTFVTQDPGEICNFDANCFNGICQPFNKDNPTGAANMLFSGFDIGSDVHERPVPFVGCDAHDECYQQCYPRDQYESAQLACDNAMLQDTIDVCTTSGRRDELVQACIAWASDYYAILRKYGKSQGFLPRQKDVCDCCE